MTAEPSAFVPVVDARGRLLSVEFDQIPFPVRRVFMVTGISEKAIRGQHNVPCEQLLVLVSGSVSVSTGEGATSLTEPRLLARPGESVHLERGTYIEYCLADESSTIAVFAEQPYQATDR